MTPNSPNSRHGSHLSDGPSRSRTRADPQTDVRVFTSSAFHRHKRFIYTYLYVSVFRRKQYSDGETSFAGGHKAGSLGGTVVRGGGAVGDDGGQLGESRGGRFRVLLPEAEGASACLCARATPQLGRPAAGGGLGP